MPSATRLRHRRGTLVGDGRPLVFGIVNVTPDSFSDGGLYLNTEAAVQHGLQLLRDGADAVDVGGESSRPGADEVSAADEIARVVPVIEGIRAVSDAVISVDTWKASVARAAIGAGADIVNDIGALRWDPEMPGVCASSGVGVVLMHTPGPHGQRHRNVDSRAIATDVALWLQTAASDAETAGITRDRIALDPGFGFGKTAEQNHELLAQIGSIVALGRPVLVGVSRKRMIRAVAGDHSGAIEGATVSAHVWAAMGGAALLRTHQVAETCGALRMLGTLLRHSNGKPGW